MPSSHKSWGLCHICGDRIMPQSVCSACGHSRCRKCTHSATDLVSGEHRASAVCSTVRSITPDALSVLGVKSTLGHQSPTRSESTRAEQKEESYNPPDGPQTPQTNTKRASVPIRHRRSDCKGKGCGATDFHNHCTGCICSKAASISEAAKSLG
ncbi:hypothetical protein B0T17DRAFT_286954 [Bombardia bombarda]|uniref:Uncharacterized protein n=1 Tax=Bombardia bombarda TaxID=252184 RepID=A0AA40C1C3_9PEZI|nr:hypothetical protein B0T17DRAFT_286954 [Bombardia bombarda]